MLHTIKVKRFKKSPRDHDVSGTFRKYIHKLQQRLPDHIPVVYKLSFLITGLVLFCMSSLSGVLVYNQALLLRNQINDIGKTVTSHLARSAREPLMADDRLTLEVLTTSLIAGQNVIGTGIISPEGEIMIEAGISPFEYPQATSGFSFAEITRKDPDEQYWRWQLSNQTQSSGVISFISPIHFKGVVAGYALVTFSQTAMELTRRNALHSIIVAAIGIILIGILIAFIISRRISRPVTHFMDAIRSINEGYYDFRFKDRRKDEIGQLMEAFNHMAEGMIQKTHVEKALNRYLSPQVASQVISNIESVKLGGQHINASVLFADIVGFTKISETMEPEELATILNRYFSLIAHACRLNSGTVDKYMGDCVMLLFGAPQHDEDHSFHAAQCALLIQRLVHHENKLRGEQGLIPIHFRIGLNAGNMLAGNMGSTDRMEYTVVGDSVNLASRLCSVAEADQIIVSKEFYGRTDIQQRIIAHEHKSISLRGVEDSVTTYLLHSVSANFTKKFNAQFLTVTDNS
ncbi:MAG: adenylate/guanylate cyclase domain-containing protein [Proteobacteria bacterium]|nr:adenylate/guanylate cyclase domain-containing protein [Pseudomonadota bacterium]MBU1714734.1 adenylate/guanylate cyclase domain-containing protein [Pseudomonadota bacterium]